MPFAESSSTSVVTSNSFTATPWSIRMNDLPSMRVSTSTKIDTSSMVDNTQNEAIKKSSINQLKDAVDDCCLKIEDQIKLTLNSIDADVIRLLLDDKYKNYFLQRANNSLTEPLNQWIRYQIMEDQLWNTDTTTTNTDQQDQTLISDNSDLETTNDDHLQQTPTMNDATMPDSIDSRAVESSYRFIANQVPWDLLEQPQGVEKPVAKQVRTTSSMNQLSIVQQFCNCDSTSIDVGEQGGEISGADTNINKLVLSRNSSTAQPQSTFNQSSDVIVTSGAPNDIVDTQKDKDASIQSTAQSMENCYENGQGHIAAAKTMKINRNMNCRVLIERLILPINGRHSKSALHPQNGGHEVTDITDELTHSVVNKSDHERTLEPNGKRKVSEANVSGDKLTKDIGLQKRSRRRGCLRSIRSTQNLASKSGKRMKITSNADC